MKVAKVLMVLGTLSLMAGEPAFFTEGGHFHLLHGDRLLVQSRPGVWTPARQALPPIPTYLREGLHQDGFDGRVLYRITDAPGGTRCVVQGRPGLREGRSCWLWESPIPLPAGVKLVAASQGRLYLRRDQRPASRPQEDGPRAPLLTTRDTRVELLRFDLDTRTLETLEVYETHPFYLKLQAILLDGEVCIVANTGLITRYDGITGARTVLVEDFVAALPGTIKRGIHREPTGGGVVELHPWLISRIFPDHEGNLCFGVHVVQPEEESSRDLVDRLKASSEAFQRTCARLGLTEATIRTKPSWEVDRLKAIVVVVNPVTRRVKTLDREAYDHLLKDWPHPLHAEPDRIFEGKRQGQNLDMWMDAKEKVRFLADLTVPTPEPIPIPTPTPEPPPSGRVAQP